MVGVGQLLLQTKDVFVRMGDENENQRISVEKDDSATASFDVIQIAALGQLGEGDERLHDTHERDKVLFITVPRGDEGLRYIRIRGHYLVNTGLPFTLRMNICFIRAFNRFILSSSSSSTGTCSSALTLAAIGVEFVPLAAVSSSAEW